MAVALLGCCGALQGVKAHVRRGVCVGVFVLSLCALGQAVQKPNAAAARENNTGVALMNQQLLAKALTHFEQAHKTDSASMVPVLNEALALMYLGRLPEASAMLEAASKSDPGNPRLWYCLGLARFDAGNQDLALEAFRRAVEIDPSNADSHYYVAAMELAKNDYAHAREDFQKAIDLSPLHASAQYGLARALQHSGMPAEARVHLQRFQEITQNKVGILFSPSYGEQGSFALAQDMLAPPVAAGSMIAVKFVPTVTDKDGVPPLRAKGADGVGACIFDVEGDGRRAIVSLGEGENAIHAYRVTAGDVPEAISDKVSGLAAAGRGVACAVGDYDNDGLPDLAVAMSDRVEVFHNLGHGKFANVTKALGILTINRPAGLTFVDFDHDGDVDLYVTGAAASAGGNASVLWRNNGNSTFTEWTAPTGLAGAAEATSVTLSDVNNDRAVDLVVAGTGPSPVVFENQREGAFRRKALYEAFLGATRGAVLFDFNKDGWMDVAVTHAGAPGVSLWRNAEGKGFERVLLPMSGIKSAWGVVALDLDNDGWVDLAALVEDSQGTRLKVLRNLGPQGFEDVSEAVGVSRMDFSGARCLLAADVDGDGAADLVVARGNEAPVILRNVGGSRHHSLRIMLTGLADNKMALGTKVEVFVNGAFQKFEVAGASGYLGQGATEILAGLGQEDHADVVRMTWPTGVPQDEIDVSAAKPFAMSEIDRRGSSCPTLFAWDGTKFQFVSDVIGAAVVGHWVSPTARNDSDSDEWAKVDGSKLRSHQGMLSLRFGEPMEEVNYIDQLRLIAVDHPVGTEVYPDERFLSEKPFASGAPVLASPHRHLPARAWGDHGEDVLPLLTDVDHRYVADFEVLKYPGFTRDHVLTLDLGEWWPDRPLRLFLSGFIEYFTANSMYAAWQAGLDPQAPSVEAQMPDGSWKKIVDDMGFPAGLPRTIVVDLTGKMPAHASRIRIRTNLQIYWDQVLVDNQQEMPREMKQTELRLSSAKLVFRGYPKQIEGKTPGDLTYDYQAISATGPFQWQRGSFTRFGAVTPLLESRDDHYVIFGSGGEIDAEFSDAALPALPPHWKRDYFFYADGFVKDMDFYEASPFTVSQMPFHGMSTYPYPATEHYPENDSAVQYQLDWNDRFETGDRTQVFQSDYEKAPASAKP
jgi:tetratricopeptide (TPR) repeat protein